MRAIVIPTYNEAKNIERLLQEIRSVFDGLIIIVDDQSPDGTATLVRSMADERVHLIERSSKLGIGSAYIEGFALALSLGAEMIGQMDADFSHKPTDIPRLLALMDQADLVLGSRYVQGGTIIGWGPWRHVCSRGATFVARKALRLTQHDITTGFRFWKADLLAKVLNLPLHSSGYAFQEEMLFHAARLEANIVEVPVAFHDRKAGRSKLGIKDIVEFFLVMKQLRKDAL